MSSDTDYKELEALARRGRWLAISTVAGSGAGHVGGPFSAMDILIALYFRVMKINPKEPRMPDRDRFILSKGHSSIGQYTVMALRGREIHDCRDIPMSQDCRVWKRLRGLWDRVYR
jgi:transketolase N-terminal domain/subunit